MSQSTAARQRPRMAPVPARAEQVVESFRATVSAKLTREELLQIVLLEGAEVVDRYPDRVLRHLATVRKPERKKRERT